MRNTLRKTIAVGYLLAAVGSAFAQPGGERDTSSSDETSALQEVNVEHGEREGLQVATIGGGCFWCVEAVYERLDGVESVVSGYAGGSVENPTYQQVSAGTTGHAEVTQITFDPDGITFEEILDWFWRAHDPTTPNRQGADVGTQYRSIILYHTDEQRDVAEGSKSRAQANFVDPIVTEIVPLDVFYPAEDYHQDYFARNPNAGYCRVVIRPKLDKLNL